MSVALLFPGQGEQRPGMLHSLPAGSDAFLDAASDLLGDDVLTLDDAESLAGTRATQLCLLIGGVAWARAALDAVRPAFLAGHSVGQWAAAVTAGSVTFTDAVRLVELRGRLMADAGPPDSGMLAIDGLPADAVATAAADARASGRRVWASNVNAPLRCTASGVAQDLAVLADELRHRGARRITALHVSVPAHTPLMAPVELAVSAALADVEVRAPSVPIAGNVSGRTLRTAEEVRRDLAESISHGVRWDLGTAILAERGVTVWVQVPPGTALLGLLPDGATGLALDQLGVAETSARVAAIDARSP